MWNNWLQHCIPGSNLSGFSSGFTARDPPPSDEWSKGDDKYSLSPIWKSSMTDLCQGFGTTSWCQWALLLLSKVMKSARLRYEQNHRMLGAGKDLCGSSSPTLLPKQGHPQQAAQDLVQAGLEYLQRRRLNNLSGQPVPVVWMTEFYWEKCTDCRSD